MAHSPLPLRRPSRFHPANGTMLSLLFPKASGAAALLVPWYASNPSSEKDEGPTARPVCFFGPSFSVDLSGMVRCHPPAGTPFNKLAC